MSPIKKHFTPINDLIKLYQKQNKSSLDYQNLVCKKCKSWLSKPVFLTKDGFNVCGGCSKSTEDLYIQNISLEGLLKDGNYPCTFHSSGCNAFSKAIEDHEKKCMCNLQCFCKKLFKTKPSLLEHLTTTHSMMTYPLTKPHFLINLKKHAEKLVNYGPFYVTAGEVKIIAQVNMQSETLYKKCYISLYDVGETSRVLKSMIKITYGDAEYTHKGNISRKLWEPSGTTTLNILDINDDDCSENIKMQVYFDDYQNFEAYEKMSEAMIKEFECPICFETIIDKCYQCVNGHNVCTDCKVKISNCPICRLQINEQLTNTRIITTRLQRLCKNSVHGCFLYKDIKEIMKHEKDCPMKSRCCEMCLNRTFDKAGFFDHMFDEHKMQILEDTSVVKPGYILWKGEVYKLEFSLDRDELSSYKSLQDILNKNKHYYYKDALAKFSKMFWQMKACWFVRLVDGSKSFASKGYQLGLDIFGRSITLNGKVQNDDKKQCLCFPLMTDLKKGKYSLKLSFSDL